MTKLTPETLWSLEEYARRRPAFRAAVIPYKQRRNVPVGEHVTLQFEDEQTIRYQVQEMLRIERTFEPAGIQGELDAYNPLIPDGGNLKATMMIEYPDANLRAERLRALRGIEHQVTLEVAGFPPITAIADEDMARANEEKTSAVHFLRFELPAEARRTFKDNACVISLCIDHPAYRARTPLAQETRQALAQDLNS
ncbi:MAG: DUF3501 family protein [Betaproteobacteria bacterium]|nr:DUF3501 family protein [Betaproteobacteria bacterium]